MSNLTIQQVFSSREMQRLRRLAAQFDRELVGDGYLLEVDKKITAVTRDGRRLASAQEVGGQWIFSDNTADDPLPELRFDTLSDALAWLEHLHTGAVRA